MQTTAYPDVPEGTIGVHSPKGNPAVLYYRADTSDLATIGSTWIMWGTLADEYELQWLPDLSGIAVDIGAHIGSVTFALLADHPNLRVIAVEPLAENVALLEATAAYNGWSDRLTIVAGGIAAGKTVDIDYNFSGNANHRFIGSMATGSEAVHETVTVPAVSLSKLVGRKLVEFLKVDCEGCEWAVLADPAIARVKRIVGEGHQQDWLARVHAALDATHAVEVIDGSAEPGTFRAVAR